MLAMARSIQLPALASSVLEAKSSGIREISLLALEHPGCLRLEVGQPDFRTPAHISEAGKKAIDDGITYYTPTAGFPSLRAKIAAKLKRVNGIAVAPEEVAVAPGGCGAISAALAALTDPGDEVLLPDPCWPNFRMMLAWTHTRGVFYPCPPAAGFLPDIDGLRRVITPRTKVLLVNSPHNPTGVVYPRPVLEQLAEVAQRHNLWLISDECYDEIILDGSTQAMSGVLDDGRVISVMTFSKTYSMTGWRLGYAVASKDVITSITKVLESTSSNTSSITQVAGEAALDGPQDCVGEMVGAYRRRRDLVVDLLREAGLLLNVPTGAFYIMADVSPSGLPSREFAIRLLKERGVGVAPGTAFGDQARDAVRISLASSDVALREGVGRLAELVQELSAAR
jgi:aspartate/methionine/tyrosine aminotransferase